MRTIVQAACLCLVPCAIVALGGRADAQNTTTADSEMSRGPAHRVAAVDRALEIGIGAGYAQGVGDIAAARPAVQDLSTAGGTVELQLGYRLTPSLTLGAYGTFAQYGRGDSLSAGTDVRAGTGGVFGSWHFMPARSIDPWVSLGSGWRGLWLVPDSVSTTSIQGWEIARLQVGADYRVTPEVAIGPALGVSVNTFFTENTPGGVGFTNIPNPHANFYFSAGLQGRFDVLGKRAVTTLASNE